MNSHHLKQVREALLARCYQAESEYKTYCHSIVDVRFLLASNAGTLLDPNPCVQEGLKVSGTSLSHAFPCLI